MKQIGIACALAVLLSSAVGAEVEGLLGYWSFDEAGGAIAGDASGNGNDGTIHGATFVTSPKGHALGFDGVDDFVLCAASKSLQQVERAGTIELWFKPEELQGGLVNWSTGSGWEDERLVTAFNTHRGGMDFIHVQADGLTLGKHSRIYPLDAPTKNAWNHLALTFDGGTIAYYLDGRLRRVHMAAYARPDIAGIPLWIGRCEGMGEEFFKGSADEVRIYNRALSSGEILAHYKEDAAAFGKDPALFEMPEVGIETLPDPGWIAVKADYSLMRPLPAGSSIEVQVVAAKGAKTLAMKVERIQPHAMMLNVIVNAESLPPGDYLTRTAVIAAGGETIGQPVEKSVSWPGRSEGFKGIKVLNNVVWELLKAEQKTINGTETYAFKSPKTRWVYVKTTADAEGGRIDISLHQYKDVISFEKGEKGTKETMRFLPAGAHELIVRSAGTGRIETLEVRSIPALVFHEFINSPFISLDMSRWDFIEQNMSSVNTFIVGRGITGPEDASHELFKKWQASDGRWRWLIGTPLPFEDGDLKLVTATEAYDYAATREGFHSPLVDGIIVDEFSNSTPLCAVYAEAVRKLAATPEYKDKFFYAYANHLYTGEAGIDLLKAMLETGSAVAWKRYLKTHSNEFTARAFLQYELVERVRAWREAMPQSLECLAVCPGYFTRPGGHLLNATPSVNYKTYLDMQFNLVANDPAFWGTFGLMSYHSGYSDEETMRWMCRLFRYYGIEGESQPATSDPYESPHLRNGDFFDGIDGWTIEPAEQDSVRPVLKRGLSRLQARYPTGVPEGETCLLMVRSANGPNTFSQEIKNLQPGRLYAFRMLTGDYKDMSEKENHALRVRIENATLIPEKSATYLYSNPGDGRYPPYDREGSAWMNYHWRVFRADHHSARLAISDWTTDDEPDGRVGQQVMYNFISVQPYFSEELEIDE